jgi:DNA-binding NtrC family response regulator
MEASNQKSVTGSTAGQLAHLSIAPSNLAIIYTLDDISLVRLHALKVLARAVVNEIDALMEGRNGDFSFSKQVASFEAELIRSALIHTGGRQRRAAGLLEMKVSTLHRKIKLYKLGTLPDQTNVSVQQTNSYCQVTRRKM